MEKYRQICKNIRHPSISSPYIFSYYKYTYNLYNHKESNNIWTNKNLIHIGRTLEQEKEELDHVVYIQTVSSETRKVL